MLKIVLSNRFKKDLKAAQKRGLNLDLLRTVVNILACGEQLDWSYRDHELTGDYTGLAACIANCRALNYNGCIM